MKNFNAKFGVRPKPSLCMSGILYACPNCHNGIERWLWGDSELIGETGEWTDSQEYEAKYCLNCGQKLEWDK
jgi:hypothetical protein